MAPDLWAYTGDIGTRKVRSAPFTLSSRYQVSRLSALTEPASHLAVPLRPTQPFQLHRGRIVDILSYALLSDLSPNSLYMPGSLSSAC